MLFGFIFTSYVIQFIYVIIMETCNLISIINCAVKIIYEVFVRFNTRLGHSSKLYLLSLKCLKQFMVCLIAKWHCVLRTFTTEPLSLTLLEKSVCLQVDFVTLNMDPHVTKVTLNSTVRFSNSLVTFFARIFDDH